MKSNLCGLLILSIVSIIYTRKYSEDKENMQRRLKYLKDWSEEISNGYIDYVFTPETGIYCVAAKDIDNFETTYKIPAKYIISFCN